MSSRFFFPNLGVPGDWDLGKSGGFRLRDYYATGTFNFEGTGQNSILFPAGATNPPSTTARSTGAKVVLYPGAYPGAADYALGIEPNTMWLGLPSANSSLAFKWYAGATQLMRLDGAGTLELDVGGGTAGANLKLNGGGTNPNKYVRALNGNLEFVNSAYSTVLFSMNDTGLLTMAGSGAAIELGYGGGPTTPYIDFHSSGNAIDYDVRLIASGGTASVGGGRLDINATKTVINGTGAIDTLTVSDTGGNGANLKLAGNGGTTPGKYVRANSGKLEVVNDGYTNVLFSLSDSGQVTIQPPSPGLGNLGALVIADTTHSAGANIRLLGNGGTAPSKYIRACSGNFEVINDAYNKVLVSVGDTGQMTVTAASAIGGTGLLQLFDTTATGGGVNIKMVGDGVTTPAKFVRVQAGSFQVVNHAYSAVIFNVDDNGQTWCADVVFGTKQAVLTAYLAANQSIPGTSTWTKLNVSVQVDNLSWMATSRYTPQRSGYYEVSGSVAMTMNATPSSLIAGLGLNGTPGNVTQGQANNSGFANTYIVALPPTLVLFNGTTDYLELFAWQNSGVAQNALGSAVSTFMQVHFIRPA